MLHSYDRDYQGDSQKKLRELARRMSETTEIRKRGIDIAACAGGSFREARRS